MRFFLPLLTGLFVVITSAFGAHAQEAGYLGEARSRYSVFFFGDSLAAGLWSGTSRMARGDTRFSVSGRFKEGSGLARVNYYDWSKSIVRILDSNEVDIAVWFIGSNDARPLRSGETLAEFGTRTWRRFYAEKVDEILAIFKERSIPVYWIELPPMGAKEHDDAVKQIARIQRAQAKKAGVRFINLRKELADEKGNYTDQGFDVNGRFRRIRSRNGVRFLKSGNNKLANILLEVVRKDVAVADGELDVSDAPPVAGESSAPKEELPVFGFAKEDGEVITLDPNDLPKPGVIVVAGSSGASRVSVPPGSAAVMQRLRASAPAGSAAEKLFNNGVWPKPKSGRFDDFSWTPPAE